MTYMAAAVSQFRLLSIGVPGGIISGFAGITDGEGVVRLGGEFVALEEPEYTLWDAGLLAPQRESLTRWGSDAGIADPDELIDAMLAGNLMTVHSADPAVAATEASRLTVRLVGHLTGNGPNRSPRFLVRPMAAGQAAVEVDAFVYEFLLRSRGPSSISARCARMDVRMPEAGMGLDEHIYQQLPFLLRNGIITLDLATGELSDA